PKEEFCSDLSEVIRTINNTFGLLDRLRAELGTTLIIASHDPLVLQRAGRVVRLMDGKEVTS
ncbi:hypothetical protein EBZ37_07035, partial [bacterium]|nr:hypothetical protein [bacterium]